MKVVDVPVDPNARQDRLLKILPMSPASSAIMVLSSPRSALVKSKSPDDFAALATSIADALTETVEPIQSNDRALRASVKNLTAFVGLLNEQMQQQWWVFGGWSSGASKLFREMEPAEAAMRAGMELTDLTSLPGGPFSAPQSSRRSQSVGRRRFRTLRGRRAKRL